MKNSTIKMMYAYLNNQSVDVDALREEVNAEYEKMVAVSKAKNDAYDAAKPIVMATIAASAKPLTVKEIYERCAAELPEDFGQAKVQYALRAKWADEVEKVDCGKNPNQYRMK